MSRGPKLASMTQGCFRLEAYDSGPEHIEVCVTCLVCGERVSHARCCLEHSGLMGHLGGYLSREHACWQAIKAEAN